MLPQEYITLQDYWSDLPYKFAHSYTEEVKVNAADLLRRVNQALDYAVNDGHVTLERHPVRRNFTSSGWRPREVNAHVKNAAVNSKHITAQAVDVYDPDGDLDDFFYSERGLRVLEACGLWLEHPSATKGWCHLQSIPPNSKRRVFYP